MPRAGRTEATFTPFADDAGIRSIGGLSIENGTDRIALHGSLDIGLDRRGLEQVRALKEAVDAIAAALESAELPEAVTEARRPTRTVKNPFA
ncbi:hypothetical protein [Methylobacterium iners]|uniref:Uncharacterized protein n=1 Tax=Methylobacterium iners TaxID=418707 RepID=A0ABQ4S3U4_9HYPH|nr:hypothetical protein [Methylobacterium iners]GJD97721.1 hypothetical protein OCOJLMKI_4954 [Methylobacterium iners]